jgi:hypothetical protein
MNLDEHKVVGQVKGGFSLMAVVLCLAALICIVALIAHYQRDEVKVTVAAREIPAFRRIDKSDLTTVSRRQGDAGPSVASLVGTLSMRALPAGEAVSSNDVIHLGEDRIGPVRFQLQPDRADALQLSPGDPVRLWLSPTDDAGAPLVLTGRLLQVPDAGADDQQTYVVGMTRGAAKKLVARLGRSQLLVTAVD